MIRPRPDTGKRRICRRFTSLRDKPALQLVFRKSCGFEATADVGPNFVATRTDRGADDGDEVRGITVEFARESVDRHRWNGERDAAPARVCGSHRTSPRVRDQQRHAIGGLDREGSRSVVADDDVRFGTSDYRPAGALHNDVCAVNLVYAKQAASLDAKRIRDGSPVVGIRQQ